MPAPSWQHTTCCLLPLAAGCLQFSTGPTQTYLQTGASAHHTSSARQLLLQQVQRAGRIACLHHHRSGHTSTHTRAAPVAAASVASVHPLLPSPTTVRWSAHSRTLRACSCLSCTRPLALVMMPLLSDSRSVQGDTSSKTAHQPDDLDPATSCTDAPLASQGGPMPAHSQSPISQPTPRCACLGGTRLHGKSGSRCLIYLASLSTP